MDGWAQALLLYAYSVFGAALLWTKASIESKHFNSFGDVLHHVFSSDRGRILAQFIVFVLIGGLVGMFFVVPITEAHALAGGMAWSRLAARD